MFKNAVLLTIAILLALTVWAAGELAFLAPYRQLIWASYGEALALFTTALFVNVLAGVYWALRHLFLADTGRKLAHLERQLRSGGSVSSELAARLRE